MALEWGVGWGRGPRGVGAAGCGRADLKTLKKARVGVGFEGAPEGGVWRELVVPGMKEGQETGGTIPEIPRLGARPRPRSQKPHPSLLLRRKSLGFGTTVGQAYEPPATAQSESR